MHYRTFYSSVQNSRLIQWNLKKKKKRALQVVPGTTAPSFPLVEHHQERVFSEGKGGSGAVSEGRLSTISSSWFPCPKLSAELERGCWLGGVETSVLVRGIPLTGQEIPSRAGVMGGLGSKRVLCCHLSPPAELCLLRKESLWYVDVA